MQLLAITFLSDDPFTLTLTLPKDFSNKPVDPLICLFYGTTFSDIESTEFANQFKQWLDELQEYVTSFIEKRNNGGLLTFDSRILEDAVFVLSAIAHKLEKEQLHSLALQLFKLFNDAAMCISICISKNTLCLLSRLAMGYQDEEVLVLIKHLVSSIQVINSQKEDWSVVMEIFSKFPFAFEDEECKTWLENHFFFRMIIKVGVEAFWQVFNNAQRDALKNKILNNNGFSGIKSNIDTIMLLWDVFNDAERDVIKNAIPMVLGLFDSSTFGTSGAGPLLWRALDETQRGVLKNKIVAERGLKQMPILAAGAAEATILLWRDFDYVEVRDAALLFMLGHPYKDERAVKIALSSWWNRIDDYQRDMVKEEMFGVIHFLNLVGRIKPLKILTSLSNNFNDTQLDTMKNTILEVLRRGDCKSFASSAVELAVLLWRHFSSREQEMIMNVALDRFWIARYGLEQDHVTQNSIQQAILSSVPMLHDEELASLLIRRVIKFLNSDNAVFRMQAFEIMMAMICHHPNHEYPLEALQNSILKNFLANAIATVWVAQVFCMQAPIP